MKLVILSGRSGTGKSVALHALEDVGYYCIDNLPITMLCDLANKACEREKPSKVAVSVDARNIRSELSIFPDIYAKLKETCMDTSIIFLQCKTSILLERFSSTRRKHPLVTEKPLALRDALAEENSLLLPISELSQQILDTSYLSINDLKSLIVSAVTSQSDTLLQFKSFGFKQGVPVDADIIFDARCLNNPYWDTNLRNLTGLDEPIQEFLSKDKKTQAFLTDTKLYLNKWLPEYIATQRAYITIAIGCTGGQHRSVYVAETLGKMLLDSYPNLQVKHRDLEK